MLGFLTHEVTTDYGAQVSLPLVLYDLVRAQ